MTARTLEQRLSLVRFALTRVLSDGAKCVHCGRREPDLAQGQVTGGIADRGPLCEGCTDELFPNFVGELVAACNRLDDAALLCPSEQLASLYHCAGMARDFVFRPYLDHDGCGGDDEVNAVEAWEAATEDENLSSASALSQSSASCGATTRGGSTADRHSTTAQRFP